MYVKMLLLTNFVLNNRLISMRMRSYLRFPNGTRLLKNHSSSNVVCIERDWSCILLGKVARVISVVRILIYSALIV